MKKLIMSGALAVALVAPASAAAVDPPTPAQFKNASKYCKALKAASGPNFASLFKNHGKCVSQTARQNAAEDAKQEKAAKQNAAKQCRAEQNDPNFASTHGDKTFNQFYGTGRNGRNAFGKCVSQKAKQNKAEADEQDKAEDQNKVNAAKKCKAERNADPQAFEQKYGTNRNKRNAFGKCVSRTAGGSAGQYTQA